MHRHQTFKTPNMSNPKPPTKKHYPKLYERGVPILLSILAIVIVAMLIFTVAVALGLITGY